MNGLRGLTMNGLRAKYPTKIETTKEFINGTVGSSKLKTYPFYTTEKLDLKGMAFTVAYKEAIRSTDNKEVCTCVCSMLNDVSSEFQNSVTTALVDIGVQPGTARLPACAYDTWDSILQEHINNSPQLDWPTILVYFGCCILTIFKKFTNEENYNTFMINSIRELRERAKCDPDAKLDIPFDFKKANAIKTMLGACSILRKDVISFLFKYMNCENSGIGSVCHYLENVLAWIDMRHLVLVNDFLIMPQSRVLHDLRVSREVENLNVAIAKVTSYPYPQFFMCMVSNLERFTVEPSMFPTLIAVAQELERADNNNNVTNFESISITGTNATMIRSLVKLHQTTFPQKSSRTSNVQMLPIKHENPQNLSRTSNVQRITMKQENPQKRSRASNVQMPQVKQENLQNRSRTSNVQMLPMKQKNPQKRSRTSNVQMPPVKQENPQNRSRTSNDQMPPMKQKNPQKRSRNSNVQMPPVKQEKSSLGRMVQVVILD